MRKRLTVSMRLAFAAAALLAATTGGHAAGAQKCTRIYFPHFAASPNTVQSPGITTYLYLLNTTAGRADTLRNLRAKTIPVSAYLFDAKTGRPLRSATGCPVFEPYSVELKGGAQARTRLSFRELLNIGGGIDRFVKGWAVVEAYAPPRDVAAAMIVGAAHDHKMFLQLTTIPSRVVYGKCRRRKMVNLNRHRNCSVKTAYVTQSVNFREGPSARSPKWGTLSRCEKVFVRGKPVRGRDGNQWLRVQRNVLRQPGFVAARFISNRACR